MRIDNEIISSLYDTKVTVYNTLVSEGDTAWRQNVHTVSMTAKACILKSRMRKPIDDTNTTSKLYYKLMVDMSISLSMTSLIAIGTDDEFLPIKSLYTYSNNDVSYYVVEIGDL